MLHSVLTYYCLMIKSQRNREYLQASRVQQQDASRSIIENNVIDVDQDPNVECNTSSTSFGCGLHKWRNVSQLPIDLWLN